MKKSKELLLILIVFSMYLCSNVHANQNSNVYVAYLGAKPHDDIQRIVDSHHNLLASVVGSKEQASKLMVHNYKHGFSGFSAKLTEAQAKKLAASPDVIHLMQDKSFKPQWTRAPDYLGLSTQLPDNILQRTNQGAGIIIGIIDSGISVANAKAFSDEGYGPIPARWKGKCESVGEFDASKHCNKKIIGAYWHRKGAVANGFAPTDDVYQESPSPLDVHGHGTHCASCAAGSIVTNVTYKGLQMGTFRGTAPRARIAVYKACFNPKSGHNNDDCLFSDVVEAFDQAIHDGVDVISASIGVQHTHGDDLDNYLNFAAYHATVSGVTVVAAAGNMGPQLQTMGNTSPWHITVAATTMDDDVIVPTTIGKPQYLSNKKEIRTKVADFSSRGPSKRTPIILKPDIAAPGWNILGAAAGHLERGMGTQDNGWIDVSGTSQATPIVAGLVALLKVARPTFSPAALKSALVTTGLQRDPHGNEILNPNRASRDVVAGPLEVGGGIASVNSASDPGLVYDMKPLDYFNYLCGVGYPIVDIKRITRDPNAVCPPLRQALMDVNLPSFGIQLDNQNSVKFTRTVTNVGPESSNYNAQINAPAGTKISVFPNVLKFDATVKQITFTVTVEKVGIVEKNAAGTLTWTDGSHNVRSPIVVLC